MPLAEFTEKTFEQYANRELAGNLNLFFAPGQPDEEALGFDAAMFTQHRFLRHIYGARRGRWLPLHWWEHVQDIVDALPPFRCNLFVQYKRPYFLTKGLHWNLWKEDCFRYELLDHQQRTLERLGNGARRDCLVLYACPSFHQRSDIWRHQRARQIVQNTNFCECVSLTGHHYYSFIASGSGGKAHSEPVDVPGVRFPEALFQRDTAEIRQVGSNSGFIKRAAEAVREALPVEERRVLDEYIGGRWYANGLIRAFGTMAYLAETADVTWAIAYEEAG